MELFEINRTQVAQGRVPARPIVERLDVEDYIRLGLVTGAIPSPVNQFSLQSGEEALPRSAVIALPAPLILTIIWWPATNF